MAFHCFQRVAVLLPFVLYKLLLDPYMSKPTRTAPKVAQASGFEFEHRDNMPILYVDGVAEAYLGIPVSRVTFHAVRAIKNGGIEQRVAVAQLTMPTAALIEMCRNILAQSASARSQLDQGFEMAKAQTLHLLNDVELSIAQPFDASKLPKNT